MQKDTASIIDAIIDDRKKRSKELWPDSDSAPFALGCLSEMIGMTLDKFPEARAFFIEQFSVKPETSK